MKSDDEMKPGKMNCGHRMEITKFLNGMYGFLFHLVFSVHHM